MVSTINSPGLPFHGKDRMSTYRTKIKDNICKIFWEKCQNLLGIDLKKRRSVSNQENWEFQTEVTKVQRLNEIEYELRTNIMGRSVKATLWAASDAKLVSLFANPRMTELNEIHHIHFDHTRHWPQSLHFSENIKSLTAWTSTKTTRGERCQWDVYMTARWFPWLHPRRSRLSRLCLWGKRKKLSNEYDCRYFYTPDLRQHWLGEDGLNSAMDCLDPHCRRWRGVLPLQEVAPWMGANGREKPCTPHLPRTPTHFPQAAPGFWSHLPHLITPMTPTGQKTHHYQAITKQNKEIQVVPGSQLDSAELL